MKSSKKETTAKVLIDPVSSTGELGWSGNTYWYIAVSWIVGVSEVFINLKFRIN